MLDTRSISSFHNGVYLTWTISGSVIFKVVNTGPSNAVISGYFFEPAAAGATGPATFVGMDWTSQGNWRGTAAGAGFGGAIDNAGIATLVDATIDGNSVASGMGANPTASDGAGINNQSGATLNLINTIVANDSGGHDLANGGTVTGDDNLVMTNTGVPTGVIAVTADPRLASLTNNGGTTPTQALQAGSPAIGAGDQTNATALDQRGFSRMTGTAVDIGAIRVQRPRRGHDHGRQRAGLAPLGSGAGGPALRSEDRVRTVPGRSDDRGGEPAGYRR